MKPATETRSEVVKRRWILVAVVIALVAVATAALIWDADPVIESELAVRRALFGADAMLPYPSALFPRAKPRHAQPPSGNRVVIPDAGINVAVVRAKSADAGLPRGVWLDPVGSVPGGGEPVVHRRATASARGSPRCTSSRKAIPVIVYWEGDERDYSVTAHTHDPSRENGIDMQKDAPGNGERLVLYTCLPRWMGDKRTVVTAVPVVPGSSPTSDTTGAE